MPTLRVPYAPVVIIGSKSLISQCVHDKIACIVEGYLLYKKPHHLCGAKMTNLVLPLPEYYSFYSVMEFNVTKCQT